MKQKYAVAISKVSIFWRYFIFLLLVMILLLASWKYSANHLSKTLRDNYLNQVETSFASNISALTDDLSRMQAVPNSLSHAKFFGEALRAQLPLSSADDYYYSTIQSALRSQRLSLVFPSEMFIYFKDSRIVLTTNRLFYTAGDCFTQYIQYDAIDNVLLQFEQDFSDGFLNAIPSTQTKVDNTTEDTVTFLLSKNSSRVLYGILYPTQTLLDHFDISTLPETTYFTIQTAGGITLAEYGTPPESADEFYSFTSTIPLLQSTVTLSLPNSYFDAATAQANRQINLLFLLVSILGIFLCILFSLSGAISLRKIMKPYNVRPGRNGNELAALENFVKEKQTDNHQLNQLLLSSVLIRLSSGIPITTREMEELQAKLSMFKSPLRMAIVHFEGPAADSQPEEANNLLEFARQSVPKGFICEYLGHRELCLIFSPEDAPYEQLRTVVQRWNLISTDRRYLCGVSTPFLGLQELEAAIRQAQFAIPTQADTIIGVYHAETDTPKQDDEIFNPTIFRQTLNSWDYDGCRAILSDCTQTIGLKPTAVCEEIFFNILFQIRGIAQEYKLDLSLDQSLTYQHDMSPRKNIQNLLQLLDELFQSKSQQKNVQKQRAYQEVADYISANYKDPMLSVSTVAQSLNISERLVSQAIVSIGDTTFSKYLQSLRMQEAARQLRDTDLELADIALNCGYPAISSFYRNFKNFYHMTPVAYRATMKE